MKDLLTLDKNTLKTVIEAVQSYALWVTLALAVILIAVAILVKFKFPDKMRGYALTAVGIAVGYAVALSALLIYLNVSLSVIKEEINTYFYIVLGLFAFTIVAVIVNVFVKLFAQKAFKYTLWASLALFVAYVIVILCVLPTEDWAKPIKQPLYITATLILVAAIVVLTVLFDRKKGAASTTKQLAYAGVCIATSFALSYLKLFTVGPQGGSVTMASMLPLMLYAYMFGAKKGVLAGIIYGLLQLIQSPQIYEPFQVLLDYPIAFSCLGLAGIFKGMKGLKGNALVEFILGMIVACFGRYFAHVISGYFIFSTYPIWESFTGKGFLYSILYNTYVLVDLAIDVAVGAVILASPAMRKQIANVNPVLNETASQTVAENN